MCIDTYRHTGTGCDSFINMLNDVVKTLVVQISH